MSGVRPQCHVPARVAVASYKHLSRSLNLPARPDPRVYSLPIPRVRPSWREELRRAWANSSGTDDFLVTVSQAANTGRNPTGPSFRFVLANPGYCDRGSLTGDGTSWMSTVSPDAQSEVFHTQQGRTDRATTSTCQRHLATDDWHWHAGTGAHVTALCVNVAPGLLPQLHPFANKYIATAVLSILA